MPTQCPPLPSEPATPPARGADAEVAAMLRRVLEEISSSERTGRLQVLTAVVLACATLMSTWCGYQAGSWSGVGSSMQAESDTAERQAAENTLAGLQIRTQDGLIVLEYWRAIRSKDDLTRTTIFNHMRPELQRAVQASIRQGIIEDPGVPGPLQQEEYVLHVESLASAQRSKASESASRAVVAGDASRAYVLVTLMLASVLFVGGIANTFSRPNIRRALGVVALIVFAVAAFRMAQLPVLSPLTTSDGPEAPGPSHADEHGRSSAAWEGRSAATAAR